jgi:hypothetical protein
MKYLLSIYNDESSWDSNTPDQIQEIMDAYSAFGREVEERGAFLAGEGLQPTSAATTVRVRNDERLITDGPFAETKEQLGGFYLLECKDLDEAIEFAAKIPGARDGSIEVRPVMNYEAVGATQHDASTAGRA